MDLGDPYFWWFVSLVGGDLRFGGFSGATRFPVVSISGVRLFPV